MIPLPAVVFEPTTFPAWTQGPNLLTDSDLDYLFSYVGGTVCNMRFTLVKLFHMFSLLGF